MSALVVKIARLQAEVAGREPVYPAARDPVARRPDPDRAGAPRLAHGRPLQHHRRRRRPGCAQAERAVAEAEATYQARIAARDSARARGARSCARWSSAASSRGSASSRPRAPPRSRRARRQAAAADHQPAPAPASPRRAPPSPRAPGMARPGGERARHRPGRALRPPAAPCPRSPTGSSAPWCARRWPAGSTGCSSPPAAARSAPARRWSRSCPPRRACWSRRGSRPEDIAFVSLSQHAQRRDHRL